MKEPREKIMTRLRRWLSGLSYRAGLWVLAVCVLCYAVSFLWFAVPISYAWRIGLWATFFGLAKAAQYSALLILGKEGVRHVWRLFKRKR